MRVIQEYTSYSDIWKFVKKNNEVLLMIFQLLPPRYSLDKKNELFTETMLGPFFLEWHLY